MNLNRREVRDSPKGGRIPATQTSMTTTSTDVPIHRRWLTAGSNAAMFIFGIVLALLGSLLPLLAEQLHFDLAQAGNLFFCMNAAMLVSMLALGVLMDRFGKKIVLVGGSALVAMAMWMVRGAREYPDLLLVLILLGAGGGALNGAANTLVADLHSDPRKKGAALNLLGVYFGFGALFLPFVIGAVLQTFGLKSILALAVALSLLPGLLFLLQAFPPPKTHQGIPFGEAGKLARHPLVLLLGFLLFFESGNEFIMGGYTSTYLKEVLGSSISAASYILTAYWAAMMMGRVVSSRLLLRVSSSTVVLVSALGAAFGGVLLFLAPSPVFAIVAVSLIGLSFASIFPTTLGVAGSQFEAYSGTVFGILFGIALTGGMSLPWVVGHLAQSRGLRLGMAVVAFDALMIFSFQWIVSRRIQKR